MKQSDTAFILSAERPIRNATEDRHGRSFFAAQIAQFVKERECDAPRDCLVIGLMGPWGSGKTSILNLVKESLAAQQSDNDSDTERFVLTFNPWLFSNQDRLLRAYFDQLTEALRTRRSTLRTGLALDTRRLVAIGDAIQTYAKIVQPLAEASHVAPGGWLRSIGEFGGWYKQRALDRREDLETLKSEINHGLQGLNVHIVTMIDDIDRLNSAEMRLVLQLVRSIGDFANTTYVIALDRALAQNALATESSASGAQFLDKIIQLPITVPLLDVATTQRHSRECIEQIARSYIKRNSSGADPRLDSQRFDAVFNRLARRRLRDERSAVRLQNLFRFNLTVLGPDVDVVDLFGVTVLQLYYPSLYETIGSHTAVFVTQPVQDARAEYDLLRQTLERCVQAEDIEMQFALDLLEPLFPKIEALRLLAREHTATDADLLRARIEAIMGTSARRDAHARKLVSDPRAIERYYRFTVGQYEMPSHEYDAFISLLADNNYRVRDDYADLAGAGKLKSLFWLIQLDQHLTVDEIGILVGYIMSDLTATDSSVSCFDVVSVVAHLLTRLESVNHRFHLLLEQLKRSDASAAAWVPLLAFLRHLHGRMSHLGAALVQYTGDDQAEIISPTHVDGLQTEIVKRLDEWMQYQMPPLRSSDALLLLSAWTELLPGANVKRRALVRPLLESEDGAVALLHGAALTTDRLFDDTLARVPEMLVASLNGVFADELLVSTWFARSLSYDLPERARVIAEKASALLPTPADAGERGKSASVRTSRHEHGAASPSAERSPTS